MRPVLMASASRAYCDWAQVSGLADPAGFPFTNPIDALVGSEPSCTDRLFGGLLSIGRRRVYEGRRDENRQRKQGRGECGLAPDGRVHAAEDGFHGLHRVRERPVAVRIVRGPHHVVLADVGNQLDAQLLLLEGAVEIAAEELSGGLLGQRVAEASAAPGRDDQRDRRHGSLIIAPHTPEQCLAVLRWGKQRRQKAIGVVPTYQVRNAHAPEVAFMANPCQLDAFQNGS